MWAICIDTTNFVISILSLGRGEGGGGGVRTRHFKSEPDKSRSSNDKEWDLRSTLAQRWLITVLASLAHV